MTHMGLVIVGHFDAGKSTATGRLLFELDGMSGQELEKLRREATELGRESFLFAFLMDKTKDERCRGLTIACTTRDFFTNRYHYTIIDAPGHRAFIKNMISGASQADVALLMVPAHKGIGGFEASIAKGRHKTGELEGQSRQHARLCHVLGVEQLIVGINKMDSPSVNWSEARYQEITGEVKRMLTKIGYKTKKIPFIPMSGWTGDNLTTVSARMPWYKGFSVTLKKKVVTGHTLLDALENVVRPPKRFREKAFRMPVAHIYKVKGVGDVVVGRIEQGVLIASVPVRFYPTGCAGKVFSIEMHHKTVAVAKCGDYVGVHVMRLKKEHMPRVGDVMVIDDADLDPNPPRQTAQFTAKVFVQAHPGQLRAGVPNPNAKAGCRFKGGFTPSIHVRTAKAPCQLVAIAWKMNRSTNGQKVESPPFIEAGDQAEVTFEPRGPIALLPFDECKPLGRFAAMDSNSLIMFGYVLSVVSTMTVRAAELTVCGYVHRVCKTHVLNENRVPVAVLAVIFSYYSMCAGKMGELGLGHECATTAATISSASSAPSSAARPAPANHFTAMLKSVTTAEDVLVIARLAHTARAFKDLVLCMNKYVSIQHAAKEALGAEARNLFVVGYKQVAEDLRQVLSKCRFAAHCAQQRQTERRTQTQTQAEAEAQVRAQAGCEYFKFLCTELRGVCEEVIAVLDARILVIPGNTLSANGVYFYKMKADYYLYLCIEPHARTEYGETIKDPNHKLLCLTTEDELLLAKCLKECERNYTKALHLGRTELSPAHPTMLGVCHKFSVFYAEIMHDTEQAYLLAKPALDNAIQKFNTLNYFEKKESRSIIACLEDNLACWKPEQT